MLDDEKENVIEWTTGQKTISVTLNQQKYIAKVKKLAEKYPDKVKILAENEDGSIYAKMPLKALKLNIFERNVEVSEERKQELREMMQKIHEKRKKN